jgi:hypothetical protein
MGDDDWLREGGRRNDRLGDSNRLGSHGIVFWFGDAHALGETGKVKHDLLV